MNIGKHPELETIPAVGCQVLSIGLKQPREVAAGDTRGGGWDEQGATESDSTRRADRDHADQCRAPSKDAPRLRELWSYDIAAIVPDDNIQYQLTEKYDATPVPDKTRQRIVTEETLQALHACTDWLALYQNSSVVPA